MRNLQVRDKIRQIYTFLKALDEHRNPVKRQIGDQPYAMRLSDIPEHADVTFVYPVDDGDAGAASSAKEYILRVRRPRLSSAPEPPSAYREWVWDGWDDPFKAVTFIASRDPGADLLSRNLVFRGLDSRVQEGALEEDPERIAALTAWQVARDRWAEVERPARQAMERFERLYKLHGMMTRESDRLELVFGDGVLNWRLPSAGIHHPILLQRVELHFDPEIPEFVIRETDAPVELYTALLRSVEGLDGRLLASLRDEMQQQAVSPLQGRTAAAFLRGLVSRLSSRGEYLEDRVPAGEQDHPRMGREPFLFARFRSLGYASAIDAVLEDLDRREDIPDPLLAVAGFEPDRECPPEEPIAREADWHEAGDVLLSREANPEQVRVVRSIARTSSVVVQGPPGTGKTHTIANLLGHLLSEGKSVLVTSHTAKALTVLREKIAAELRPLCISVLGNDIESRRQLESSVNAIVGRLDSSEAARLEARAAALAQKRENLIEEIEQLRYRIIESRKGEFGPPVVVGGRSLEPSQAAREAARGRTDCEWLPGPLLPGAPLPLSQEEIREVYHLNAQLSTQDEAELCRGIPMLDGLPNPEVVSALAEGYEHAKQQDRSFGEKHWNRPVVTDDQEPLRQTLSDLADAATWLGSTEPWSQQLVEIALRGQGQVAPWHRLLEEIAELRHVHEASAESLYRYGPTLPDMPLEEQIRSVEEILEHLASGGRLTWLNKLARPSWKRFIEGARIRNVSPTRADHFQALRTLIISALKRRQVVERWNGQAEPIGLPAVDLSDPSLDRKLPELRLAMEFALTWPARVWRPLRERMSALGFAWARFETEDQPEISATPELDRVRRKLGLRLQPVVQARFNAARWQYFSRLHNELRELAAHLRRSPQQAAVQAHLAQALDVLNAQGYEMSYRELKRLARLTPLLNRRELLLAKLAATAPLWAGAINERQGVHAEPTPPGDAAQAWDWRQVEEELERRNQESLSDLQQAIERKFGELRRITIELIGDRAWAAQGRRVNHKTRQALVGWQDIVRKIPKTSTVPGKLAWLRSAAQEAMRECREAVPVWIMPMARVVESFDFTRTRFDVVIIDEASQTDVMGLLVYYLADKVLVVGDHEQVSPSAVGQKEEIVQQLISEHLQGIPNAVLYDGKTSVYDLARASARGIIRLLEHFRCAPEIIQFSNDLSYDGTILPLRDPSSIRLHPHLVPRRVAGSSPGRRINPQEAESVAALVAACVEQPEYRGLSIGVISMVRDEQALEIDGLLRRHLSPVDYERHRIVCGNSAQFQGDERDVMFLSMVDCSEGSPLAMRDQPMFRQRFNVAASRARDQLWVVYSVDPETDLKPRDLRRRLIEHALNPQALIKKLDSVGERVDSEFEQRVLKRLRQHRYRVKTQYRVGYYRIDLVVEGGGKRLAVECDGDRYHPIEKLGEDMARQATLERLGWRFVRIRGTEFFRHPERAMEPVFEALDRLEIPPEDDDPETPAACRAAFDDEMIQRIERRAAEVRRSWSAGRGPEAATEQEPHSPGESSAHSSRVPPGHGGEAENNDRASGEPRAPITQDRAHQDSGEGAKEAIQATDGEDDRDQLSESRSTVWLALSHWARVNEQFQGWERGVLYTVGRNLAGGRGVSAKQARHANRLLSEAVAAGFAPDAPDGQPEEDAHSRIETGARSHREAGRWESIKQVPQQAVHAALLANVPPGGKAISREDLLQCAKGHLGFDRLGKEIRSRLNRCIGGLVRAGRLETDWISVWRTSREPIQPQDAD